MHSLVNHLLQLHAKSVHSRVYHGVNSGARRGGSTVLQLKSHVDSWPEGCRVLAYQYGVRLSKISKIPPRSDATDKHLDDHDAWVGQTKLGVVRRRGIILHLY